jgi:hypothetical protein
MTDISMTQNIFVKPFGTGHWIFEMSGMFKLMPTGVGCNVVAIKCCPVLHFSVVIFSGPSESLSTAYLKCLVLSTVHAGAKEREEVALFTLTLMYKLNQTESAIFM